MTRRLAATAFIACLAGCAGHEAAAPARVAAAQAADPLAPAQIIHYGKAPQQVAELFLPAGPGPHPVVFFIHGGCYRASVATAKDVRPTAAALAKRGLAVWSVEYRSIDQAGGAYPGMFADIAAAGDRLAKDAHRYNLALDRLVISGHSAGGHLALWEAGRNKIAKPSVLAPTAKAHGLRPRAVVNLAGPGALGGDAKALADKTCGPGSFDAIFGTPTASRPDVFADTLPARLLPLKIKTLQFVGAEDKTVPPQLVLAYDKAARAAGEDITTRVIPGADHLAVVDPRTPAFAEVAAALTELTR